MNSKLKEVLEAVLRLPERDQEELAAVILQELEDEAKWDAAFEASQPQLKHLAEEALEDYRAGRTEPLDPDAL
jgi:hypothetical protein